MRQGAHFASPKSGKALSHRRVEAVKAIHCCGPRTPPSRHPIYGIQRIRFCKSYGAQFSQTINSPSMTAPIGLREGINSTPGDSFCLMNRRKWPGIVATSRETGTRSASAAIRRTSGSGCRPGSPLRRRENLLPVPAAAILGRSRGLGRRRPGNEGSILLLCPFALPSLKTLDHAGREGVAGLDLFVATILIFEIRLDFFWMLQDKRNCAVDLGQRSDRRVGIKDRFGRPPIPKIVCNHVKSNSGSGDVVSTVPNFHILVA